MTKGKAVNRYLRAKIRQKYEDGATIPELMKEFSMPRRTLQRICSERRDKPKPRGRPPKLSPSDSRRLLQQSRETPMKSARQLANLIRVSVSSRTIKRELKKKGFVSVKKRRNQRVSPQSAVKRLQFAKEQLPKGNEFWNRVIFTDEKKWNLLGNDGYVRVWCEKSKKYTIDADLSRRPGVMVWGAISQNGARYLHRITGTVLSESYQNILKNELINPGIENLPENFVFQHDNAPAHRAKATIEFLQKEKFDVLPWPPYSPDLNIIENLWGIVSQKVYEEGKDYQNADELWESVLHHFMAIPDEVINSLYKSVSGRLISVVELGGKRTKY